jgi:hypothetical protein
MEPTHFLGKTLVAAGAVIVAVGLALIFWDKLPLGRLPGDIVVRKPGFTVYFPWVTSLLASIILSIMFYIFRK